MTRFVVLLRGVNVGKNKRIAMTAFAQLLEAQGFSEVRTLLNSGNAVFTGPARASRAHAAAIRSALIEELGLDVSVVVKSAREFGAAVSENPIELDAEEFPRLLVAFAQEAPTLQALQTLASLVTPVERFAIGAQAAYLFCGGGILESKAGSALSGKLGKAATTRNWATVLKLQALLGAKAA